MNIQKLANKTDEFELVIQAQRGNRDAFGELVRIHHQSVINLSYRLCADIHLAEDATQEAFIKAWQNLYKYKPQAAFRNWLFRIAANTVMDRLRSQRPGVDIDTLHMTSPTIAPEAALIGKERAMLVQSAIMDLPPNCRVALILREYEQFSYKEIAETLNIPLGTVMSRLSYARKRLLEELTPTKEIL